MNSTALILLVNTRAGVGELNASLRFMGDCQNRVPDRFCTFSELFLAEIKLRSAEIDIADFVNGHQMDVSMSYLQPDHGNTDPFARVYAFDALGNDFRKNPKPHVFVILNIEKVVRFPFGNYQYMTCGKRIDIQKRKVIVAFGDFMRWNFTGNDF